MTVRSNINLFAKTNFKGQGKIFSESKKKIAYFTCISSAGLGWETLSDFKYELNNIDEGSGLRVIDFQSGIIEKPQNNRHINITFLDEKIYETGLCVAFITFY
ncbi:MAG TPA: hypothetical protein VMW40_03330 [Candidatus Bathyarchaeia archaeon]|nr:hypothetical protein [Candidatus Bathyarchaeia archaeon]